MTYHRRCRTRSPFPERNGSLVAPNGDEPLSPPRSSSRGKACGPDLSDGFSALGQELEAKDPTKRGQRPADGACEDRLLLAGAAAGSRRTRVPIMRITWADAAASTEAAAGDVGPSLRGPTVPG